jgi:hypothetical protein
MQCCRSNFRVGSRVSWTLTDPGTDWLMTVLGDDVTVDAAEEHHRPGSRSRCYPRPWRAQNSRIWRDFVRM